MTAPAATAPLISVAELLPLVGARDLLLLDCRHELANPGWGEAAYAAGHLPGARFAHLDHALSGPRATGTGRHPLPTAAAFARTLGSWGYTPAARVVAYDQGNGAYAARLWWLLRARGHLAVQVLDGGLAGWLAAGGPVTTTVPAVTTTTVEPREFAGWVSTAELQAALAGGGITLVDARGADRFAGQNETIDPVPGHVPGAISHPFATNLSPALQFLPPAELRARWAPILARAPAAPVVAMCGSGVTACHNLLALELAGYRQGRLYAGSYSEWITDPARPVATGVQ